MSIAPERIWAYYDRAGYTFTALGALPSYFENVEYIRADLTADPAELARLREENERLREVNAAQAQRIEALQEQLRQAQQRRTFARSGE